MDCPRAQLLAIGNSPYSRAQDAPAPLTYPRIKNLHRRVVEGRENKSGQPPRYENSNQGEGRVSHELPKLPTGFLRQEDQEHTAAIQRRKGNQVEQKQKEV